MISQLDQSQGLTGNQRRVVTAVILGGMLEFFDFFLIGFVLVFIVQPWGLSFMEAGLILVSSGLGSVFGAFFWGAAADRVGRRPMFMATVLTFSISTGILALTPTGAWGFLGIFRFLVGFGVGGLQSVDIPLLQEYMPSNKRGMIAGLTTVFVPAGTLIAAMLGAYLAPVVGWRGLFVVGLLPALLALLVRAWVPESPRWLSQQGRHEDAKRSLAWALEIDPSKVVLPSSFGEFAAIERKPSWTKLFSYKRSWLTSCLTQIGMQSTVYGITLWGVTLISMLAHVSPAQASFLYIFVTLGGMAGRVVWSLLAEKIGRKTCGVIFSFFAAIMVLGAAFLHNYFIGGASVFWIMLIVTYFFADGGFSVVTPYAAEVWPTRLRTSGMGLAYGMGSLGKIFGPMGLALVVGSSNLVTPAASEAGIIPAFIYLACFAVLAGLSFSIFGFETKGKTLEEIDEYVTKPGGRSARTSAGRS